LRPVVQLTQLAFTLDGHSVEVEVTDGESLLSVLRERLRITSVKDGCAPQGQCGCCTVLVDGDARVACVTPAARVAGRSVTTLGGLDAGVREPLVDAFVATGASQCGFCTPGIVVRLAALLTKDRTARADVDRALAAHLCRCTGWQTIHEAFDSFTDFDAVVGSGARTRAPESTAGRDLDAAARRAELEGGVAQQVGVEVPGGDAGFADDGAPAGALVAVPRPPGSEADAVEAAGVAWVVGDSLLDARTRAGKVQGRRTTVADRAPLPLPDLPEGGVRLTTAWVEPAYLELDASWCEPGGEPATPLANGGAFGGKADSPAPAAARALADARGRAVRVVLAREDVVRLGPKRPPIAATAILRGGTVEIRGTTPLAPPPYESPYALAVDARWDEVAVPGPSVSNALRAAGLAEHTVLVEGALDAVAADRAQLVDARGASVLLDTLARSRDGALAGAHVDVDPVTGAVTRVRVRVDAGAPIDAVVLRSYAIGAAHMALGWVLAEGLAVDPGTGDVLDLTIRSFGIIRAKSMPPVDVEIVGEDARQPRALASDAVFAAVAAATWNAVTRAEGERPDCFPAVGTGAARMLRR
jgi:aerobic-type carbon monoxide dehydrogenase small subunit (CoxS/CutS family)